MPPAGFKPTIPASEPPQTHALDCAATGIGPLTVTDCRHDLHESVHRDIIMKVTNKMQLYRLIYYSKLALHVSGDVFAHHQEHLTVFAVSDSISPSGYRLVS